MFTVKQMDKLLPTLLDALSGKNRLKFGFSPIPPNNSSDDGTKRFYDVELGLKLDEPGFSKLFISNCNTKMDCNLLLL